MEDHIKLLKSGRDLASLEVIAPPTVPIPNHVSMFLMRPPANFYPMMPSIPPGRMPPGMDPSMAMRVLRPIPPTGMVSLPGGMVGMPSDEKHMAHLADPSMQFSNIPKSVVS